MAITYAWRIDSNKFSYIISPDKNPTDEDAYGYVSETPLIGDSLLKVKENAEFAFDPTATDGAINYLKAFNKMVSKIKDVWKLDQIDLLSADVYYNVDASECADLRGVGIKGIRYLGAATEVDNNGKPIAYSPNVSLTLTNEDGVVIPNPMIGGKFSVYGIYMEDQYDKDGNLKTNISPENMFLVYNGANGAQGEGGENIYDSLEAYVNEKITDVRTDIFDINDDITRLEGKIEQVSDFATFQLVINTIQELQTTISGLTKSNQELSDKIKELEDELEAIKDSNVGDGEEETGGSNITVGDYDPNKIIYLVGIDESQTLYKLERAQVNSFDIVIDGNVYATAQYKGPKPNISI